MPLERIISPEAEAKVGNSTPLLPVTDEVSKSEVRRWVIATLDDNPLWHDPTYAARTRFGSGLAPAPFVRRTWGSVEQRPGRPDRMRIEAAGGSARGAGEAPQLDTSAVRVPLPAGVTAFHGDDETEYFQYPRIGDAVNVTVHLVKLEQKRGRSGPLGLIYTDHVYTNQRGETLAIVHFIQVAREVARNREGPSGSSPSAATAPASAARSPERSPATVPSGGHTAGSNSAPSEAALRATFATPTNRYFDEVSVGTELPQVEQRFTLPIMMRWCAATETWARNHWDAKHTIENTTLPGPVMSGGMAHAYVWQLLTNWVGPDAWVYRVQTRNAAMVHPDQTLVLSLKVTNAYEKSGLGYVEVEGGLRRKEDGSMPIPARATLVLPIRGGRPVPYPFPQVG